MPYERSSNRFYTWLWFDPFMGPDGSFQYSKNIDVRRNPKGFQLVPKLNATSYWSTKITAMLGVDTTHFYSFSVTGRVYLNHSLVYILTGAVTSLPILNACIFKDYMYIFTASWVHRITIANANANLRAGNITENYINYAVTAYSQPLDDWFTTAVLDFKNAAWVVTNFSMVDKDWNAVSWTSLATISSGYTQVSGGPFTNGPFVATYDFVPIVWSRIPVIPYYDSVLYVALQSIVIGYQPQLSAIPDVGRMIELERNQNIVWMTAHDTQFRIYVQIDLQNSRQYFRSGEGLEPQAIIEWEWIVIQNVGTMGNADFVVTNDPRNEISSLYKTEWYQRQLIYEGKKLNGNVLNGEFHCLPMNQTLCMKKNLCFIPAEQWIYASGNFFEWFPLATTLEWQWATQIRPRCETVYNSYLYVSYQDISNSTYYIGIMDLNYEPTLSSTSQESSWELIQRVHTGERVADTKTILSIEVWYEFTSKTLSANNPTIELWIKCNRFGSFLKLRTIDAINSQADISWNRVIIDPQEIISKAVTAGATTSYIDFNMLEWKAVINAGNGACKAIVYEVNILYDLVNPNDAR